MPEKAILAYFHSPEQALGVKAKLAALRAAEVTVRDVEGVSDKLGFTGPLTGYAAGLSEMVMETSPSSPDAGVLLAADPNASGMSGGAGLLSRDNANDGASAYATRNIALTAIVDDTVFGKACRLIEQGGGVF